MADTSIDHLSDIQRVGRQIRWWAVLGGNGIVFLAGIWWLTLLTGFELEDPALLRAVVLLLYLLSWIWGTRFDLSIQLLVYPAYKTRVTTRPAISIVVILIVLGAILFIALYDDELVATALTIFFLANVCAWRFFVRFIEPFINASLYSPSSINPKRLSLVRAVANYLTGNWQWHRFAVMLLITGVVAVVSFSFEARQFAASEIQKTFRHLSADAIAALLPALFLGLFVLVAEGWNWLMRLRVYFAKRRMLVAEQHPEVRLNGAPPSTPKTGVGEDEIRDHRKRKVQREFFELQMQWSRFLWAAHVVGLGTSLKFLNDYLRTSSPHTQGIGMFVLGFSYGFVLAVLAYVSLTVARDTVMHKLSSAPQENIKDRYIRHGST